MSKHVWKKFNATFVRFDQRRGPWWLQVCQGDPLPNGKKSLTWHLWLVCDERTVRGVLRVAHTVKAGRVEGTDKVAVRFAKRRVLGELRKVLKAGAP